MIDLTGKIVVLPWFNFNNYPADLKLMADASTLPKSYDEWFLHAKRLETTLKEQGQRPVRVEVDPHGFVAWCIFHDLSADSVVRKSFAAHVAAESVRALGRKKFER